MYFEPLLVFNQPVKILTVVHLLCTKPLCLETKSIVIDIFLTVLIQDVIIYNNETKLALVTLFLI